MPFDAFLEAAWNDHGDRPCEVADRLAASLDTITAPEHVAQYARIVTHVYGEHLGEWARGVGLLRSLRELPAFDRSPAAEGAVARGIGALRYAEGDARALEALSQDDRIAAIATAASAFAGLGEFKRALDAYAQALALADAGLPEGSPALRALAIGGNNLAAALEEKRDRDDAETQGMVAAAQSGLDYWKRAGTWFEEERAHWRLAKCLLAAGRPREAVASAVRCVEVCDRNEAPAFERFFGHAALAFAHREAGDAEAFGAARRSAFACYEQIPDGERTWCEADLKALADR
jgi:tetratricopeptide (TPR) repeat protein